MEGVKLKLLSNLDIRCGDFYVTNRAQEQLSISDIFHCHMKINNYILRRNKSLFSLHSTRLTFAGWKRNVGCIQYY